MPYPTCGSRWRATCTWSSTKRSAPAAAWLAAPVVLIAGTHEFYHAVHGEKLRALREKAASADGVHFLKNDPVALAFGDPRARILSCTLWSDFALSAPNGRSVPPRYRKDLLSAAYASDLDALVETGGAALWVHGHTHKSADHAASGRRVICNARIYRPSNLNKRFNPDLIIAV